MDALIDYFLDFKEWLSLHFTIYSDDEYDAVVYIQRRFREKMYRRRCKYTQTNITTVDRNVQVDDVTFSSWHLF